MLIGQKQCLDASRTQALLVLDVPKLCHHPLARRRQRRIVVAGDEDRRLQAPAQIAVLIAKLQERLVGRRHSRFCTRGEGQ